MPGGVTTEVKTYQMYINGEWVTSKSARELFRYLTLRPKKSYRAPIALFL